MESIFRNFIINKKKKNSYNISREIFKKINLLSSTYTSKTIINFFSKTFEIPKDVLWIKFKKLTYNTFDYNISKFNNKTSSLNIFTEVLRSIFLFLLIIFAKNEKKRKKYDFIIYGLTDEESFERYEKLIRKFKSTLVTSYYQIKKKNYGVSFLKIPKIEKICQEAVNEKKLNILSFFFKIFFLSIIHNFNYLYFYNLILYSIIKNFTFFNLNRGKYFMEERFYRTCSLRNFYFKKFGGKITSTPQKNIVETSISFFIDTDIFFSLGDEKFSLKRLRNFGARINKNIPIGSFYMEQNWYRKKKDLSKIPRNQILITGLNPNTWLQVNDLNFKNYEFTLRQWIKDISNVYPKLNIMVKHHSNLKSNSFEEEFFKDTNVKSVIKSKSLNHSYGYMYKSDLILSFGSTTVLEAISMNKQGYFIDPSNSSKCFFYNLNNLKDIRISKFKDLKRIVENTISKKIKKKLERKKYCLKSDRVSEIVYKYFKKIN